MRESKLFHTEVPAVCHVNGLKKIPANRTTGIVFMPIEFVVIHERANGKPYFCNDDVFLVPSDC